jgi:hypothetical protein
VAVMGGTGLGVFLGGVRGVSVDGVYGFVDVRLGICSFWGGRNGAEVGGCCGALGRRCGIGGGGVVGRVGGMGVWYWWSRRRGKDGCHGG